MGKPTDTERGQWYFQRYFSVLPSAGEIVLFDRSWSNRAVVERVMGFCSDRQYEEFMTQVPGLEQALVDDGCCWSSCGSRCRGRNSAPVSPSA